MQCSTHDKTQQQEPLEEKIISVRYVLVVVMKRRIYEKEKR
jgi:hypothetical protein